MKSEKSAQEFRHELEALDLRFSRLSPELSLTVRDPELDVEGYVVVWSTLAARGGPLGACGKGGTRITPQVSLQEVEMLARIMTLKNAAAGLPLGGAKSGLRADPAEAGFETKYRRFVTLTKPILRENGGSFGGYGFDLGGRPEHALWACDELGSRKSFTGKPLEMGGTDYDRQGIAGLGVATAATTLLMTEGREPQRATFAVQGLGAMGAAVVRYFSENGSKLRFVSDSRVGGTYHLPAGPTDALLKSMINQDFETTAALLSGYERRPLDEILYTDVDVLFPCAVQDVVTAENVSSLRCRFLIEGANSPCTHEARTLLFKRGITVIPDFIANPGGIVAAFIEMTTADDPSDPDAKARKAKTFTREKIGENVEELMRLARQFEVEPSEVGRYMAYRNIFKH